PGPPGTSGTGVRVAVGGGAAFTFGYQENIELLEACGAEVVTVDPLRDEALPAGTRALVLGGGFPEVYGSELSANAALRREVAGLAAHGAPVAAECAGLLYLARSLDGHPMCGVVDAEVRMNERLTLGYREARAPADSPLAAEGTEVRGHEFHRTVAEPRCGGTPAWQLRVDHGEGAYEGFVVGSVHASYLHLHWAGHPAIARRFVALAARRRQGAMS
ncbi:MAG: cobyrinic acid a,c-diamide synthase, partial [Streptosporangiales bacterium]|nr:cobyrinic acid a,c-diamide synthase [Streptosporangiales bacterium]